MNQSNFPMIVKHLTSQWYQLQDYKCEIHTKFNQSFSGYFWKEEGVRQEELKRKTVTKKKRVEEKREKLVEMPRAEG